jgi:hypothetical protein
MKVLRALVAVGAIGLAMGASVAKADDYFDRPRVGISIGFPVHVPAPVVVHSPFVHHGYHGHHHHWRPWHHHHHHWRHGPHWRDHSHHWGHRGHHGYRGHWGNGGYDGYPRYRGHGRADWRH